MSTLPAAFLLFFGVSVVVIFLAGEWPALVAGALAGLAVTRRALACTIDAGPRTVRVRNLIQEVELPRSAIRGTRTRGLLPWTDVPAVGVIVMKDSDGWHELKVHATTAVYEDASSRRLKKALSPVPK